MRLHPELYKRALPIEIVNGLKNGEAGQVSTPKGYTSESFRLLPNQTEPPCSINYLDGGLDAHRIVE